MSNIVHGRHAHVEENFELLRRPRRCRRSEQRSRTMTPAKADFRMPISRQCSTAVREPNTISALKRNCVDPFYRAQCKIQVSTMPPTRPTWAANLRAMKAHRRTQDSPPHAASSFRPRGLVRFDSPAITNTIATELASALGVSESSIYGQAARGDVSKHRQRERGRVLGRSERSNRGFYSLNGL